MPLSIVTALADVPNTLVDDFAQGDGLLWTGAGVSRRQSVQLADGSNVLAGVPAAAALESHLRRWTPEPHPRGANFEELATIYAQRFGRRRLNRLLHAAYFVGARVAPPFYERITRLPLSVRVFVTTNYDPFLERALSARHPTVVVVDRGLESVSHHGPAVYKVHGDAEVSDTCVITTPDYDRWDRNATQLKDVLSSMFVQHTVVALGYRAQDGNFRRLLGAVNARVRARAGRARTLFVVTPDAALENFAAYDVPEHEVVLVRATGEDFLDWLLARLRDRERALEAEALRRMIDAPNVRDARDRSRALRPPSRPDAREQADQPDEAWVAYAEALLDLAGTLHETRRYEESIRTRAAASRALRVAGADARADATAREAYTAALERRDARLADDLHQRLTWPVAGTQRVRAPEDQDVVYFAALADVLSGQPGAPPTLLTDWAHRSEGAPLQRDGLPPTASSETDAAPVVADAAARAMAGPAPFLGTWTAGSDPTRYRLARLSAEYAVTLLNVQDAARYFGEAADFAPSPDERADCQVRTALFSGLAGGSSGPSVASLARARLQSLAVPDTIEPLRRRAEAWLTALEGDLALAAEGFVEAGKAALAGRDAVGAAGAYRSAQWAASQRPNVDWVEDHPGALAYRLESSVARYPDATRVSAHELREEAERHLLAGKTREAWLAALAAQRLAYDDLDPGNVHRARIVLAEVWERTLEAGGEALEDGSSVLSAIYYTTHAHASLDDAGRKRRAEVLGRVLAIHADSDLRRELVASIDKLAVSRAERISALLLLADLADVLQSQEVEQVAVPLLRAGIADGWGANKSSDAAGAACSLLGAVQDQLSPAAAARIRDDLARIEGETPGGRRGNLYLALAQATDRAGPLPDGGTALSGQLLDTLSALRAIPAARTPHYRGELGMALAAVMVRAGPAVSARICQELEQEAAARHREGVAVLATRGIALPQALLDDYLRDMTSRMQAVTRPADRTVFGMSPSDDSRLTQRASEAATAEVRHAAIDAVIALLNEDRQREVVRAEWVACAVRLAWGTPERRADLIAALLRLATGAFAPSGFEMPFGDHTLSGFRASGFEPGALQGDALHGLGALWAHVGDEEHPRIRAALEDALDHSDPVVRKGAVLGLQSTVTSAQDWGATSAPRTSGWQIEALVRALADPLPVVSSAARRALVALARPARL